MVWGNLWKYCTAEHCREMLLSFKLLGENDWPEDKVMACLYALSNHSEKHYHMVKIAKKSSGTRSLLVPDPLLKYVQRNLLDHVLKGLTVSECASAYREGSSVMMNAEAHTGRKLVMKMDIEDFFGTITFPMVLHHAFPSGLFPPAVGTLLASLCCYRDYLPQGAPTSPAISNLVMRPFDEYMKCWCGERGITYTRYCDDMTFSGDFHTAEVKGKVYGFLRAMGFEPNQDKTRILSRGTRQMVTGLVVNEKAQVSGPYRRRLRQEIYYCEKYGVEDHLSRMGGSIYLEEGKGGIPRYLTSLLGKVNYVLLTRPDDLWFRAAKGRLKSMLAQAGEE